MSEETVIVLATVLYKLACLVTGTALSHMGYRLFMSGVWGQAGDLDAKLGDNKIVIKAAAPGTFFVIAGAVVLGLAIFKGVQFDIPPSEILDNKPGLP